MAQAGASLAHQQQQQQQLLESDQGLDVHAPPGLVRQRQQVFGGAMAGPMHSVSYRASAPSRPHLSSQRSSSNQVASMAAAKKVAVQNTDTATNATTSSRYNSGLAAALAAASKTIEVKTSVKSEATSKKPAILSPKPNRLNPAFSKASSLAAAQRSSTNDRLREVTSSPQSFLNSEAEEKQQQQQILGTSKDSSLVAARIMTQQQDSSNRAVSPSGSSSLAASRAAAAKVSSMYAANNKSGFSLSLTSDSEDMDRKYLDPRRARTDPQQQTHTYSRSPIMGAVFNGRASPNLMTQARSRSPNLELIDYESLNQSTSSLISKASLPDERLLAKVAENPALSAAAASSTTSLTSLVGEPTRPKLNQRRSHLQETLRKEKKFDDTHQHFIKRNKQSDQQQQHHNHHHTHGYGEKCKHRFRDYIGEIECKRYAGLFAANKGILVEPYGEDDVIERLEDWVDSLVVLEVWSRSSLPDDTLADVW